jgi:hypothetical protein
MTFSVLGMLQVGPLQQYLYKSSVSVRGYYWRAGLEMLSSHPFFGVGIDRYGSYFKQYREVDYPLNVGFQLTSSNAHNTFIQFFATGGIFLGITYLALNLFVLHRAIIGIKNLKGNQRLYLVGILSAWISFHAQSLVSIDNIGISIWGWVLAGSIIGLSLSADTLERENEFYLKKKRNDINILQALISGASSILVLSLVVLLYRGESNSYQGGVTLNLQDEGSRTYFRDLQLKVINTPLNDLTYKLFAASRLIDAGFEEDLPRVDPNLPPGTFLLPKLNPPVPPPPREESLLMMGAISEESSACYTKDFIVCSATCRSDSINTSKSVNCITSSCC